MNANSFDNILQYLTAFSEEPCLTPITNFINNEFVASSRLMESFNPATGLPWVKIPNSTDLEVSSAISAAKEAFKTALDIPRCIQNFRAFAAAIQTQTAPSAILEEPVKAVSYVKYDPIGVAGLISPWNLPLYLLSFKIAPALAAGNTIVCKPSEMTSVTAWALMHAIKEVGFPPGVVNLVMGEGATAGQYLVDHPDVPLISFTGSTLVGKMIQEKGARLNKKVSLEMGGKNPAIVFSNYNSNDLPLIVKSCFFNQGEICLCTSRLFVQADIFDDFVKKFVQIAKNYSVGDPADNVNIGAINSKQHFQKIKRYIEYAKEEGGIIHCGGVVEMPGKLQNGYFIAPTVITGISDSSKCMTDEIFGPVICLTPFRSIEEVVTRANATEYGLSATVWSTNSSDLLNTAHALRAGTVWCNTWMVRDLNMPFGGCKQSGQGREGIHDSLHFYADAKTVCVKLD
ncbi:unnamed protein product [Caenorhabditis bovis]|uniref:Aldehyde dehydrogenase domain-containing protein n=1 Tax=Caenorhabditis bovis TaxID=2654633 RepID=A0A8S1EEH7_9PELO|nr:unnamed protein product [Caenorhabditis bovis]